MAAEERRGLRERGEWPAVLEAARLKITHRTAEEAVGEVLDAVAIRH